MSNKPVITLGICLAAGLALGLALARPGNDDSVAAGSATVEGAAPAPAEEAAPAAAGGYGGGGGAAPAAPAAPAQAATGAITIADFEFGAPITVAPGAAITVTNADGAGHTVTATDGSFDSGTVNGGATGTFTAPTAPGTYEIFCSIHPSMQGSLSIQG